MDKLSTQPDTCLLDYLKEDDFAAFEEIYNRYWRLLYSISYKRTQSSEVSEEIVQDIFTSLWEKRKAIRVENLSAYLCMAARYKIINHFHREMSKRNYLASQPHLSQVVENCTEETVLLQDLDHAFQHEIEKLPAKRKMIFKLYRQQNLSMKQVASQLGISEKTVENQLNKAFKMLRVSLRHFLSLASLVIVHIASC
jgi:RNA polymerase sigma-70 factor (ECF subfamily)